MRLPYRHRVVLLCTFAFFATMVARVVISPVVPDLTEAFTVSTGAIGLALSGMWAAYALTQFPSGVLADRHGERLVIVGSVAATGAMSLLVAASTTFVWFLAFTVGLGGAAGLVYSAATSLVTKQADRTGRAIGAYTAGGPLAGLLAPPAAAAVGGLYDWRAAIILGVAVSLPAAVLVGGGIRQTPPTDRAPEILDTFVLVDLLARPPVAFALGLAVLGAFTWQATASFLPAFLEAHHGYSRASASLLFSAYFVVHGATQPVTGALSDRLSRNAATAATMGLGVLGFALLIVASSSFAVVVAIVLVGTAMSWGAPLQSKFMDNLSSAEQGTGFGLVRTVYMSLGSLGSVVTGTVVDFAGWAPAFWLLAACMALGTGLLAIAVARRCLGQ